MAPDNQKIADWVLGRSPPGVAQARYTDHHPLCDDFSLGLLLAAFLVVCAGGVAHLAGF